MSKSNKKQVTQTSSLAALSRTTEHSQATKKAISTEQIEYDNIPSELQKQLSHFHIQVPFQINIKSLVKHLKIKITENQQLLLLHSDEKQGQILLQQKPTDECWLRFLDCLCICRKEGWPKKGINQMYEVVSISVKRQYVQQRCLIGIKSNYPRVHSSNRHLLFVEQLIYFIKKCLETFKDPREYPQIKEIDNQSPLGFQMNAMKAIQGILKEGKSDKRIKTLYDTSILKIRTSLEDFEKQGKLRISDLIQKIINETNSIFNSICTTPGIGQMGLHLDFTLYAVENMYCYTFLSEIFQIYKKEMKANCEQFNKNCYHINANLTNSQYFDFLEVRQKFRLPKTQNPYGRAISALRTLQNATNLRDMLLCVQKTFSLIKIECLQEHKGKLQISSMDDILPVMIFVVAKAQITDFPVYVKIVDDYIRIRGTFELQERVITTLYVATEDISKKIPSVPQKQ